jgi:hypothetical protein
MVWSLWAWVAVAADVEFTHSGRLTSAAGLPVDGAVSLTVRLFTQASPTATPVEAWSDTFASVPVDGGYFTVVLGSGAGLPASVFDAPTVLVEHQIVGLDPMAPRQTLFRVPQADVARRIASATSDGPCDQPGALVWDDANDRIGVCDGSVWRRVATTAPPPPNQTRQPGTEGVDTYVRSSLPSNTWGTEANLRVGGWGDTYETHIKFDLTGFPATPAATAQIHLFAYQTISPANLNFDLVTSTWSESTTWSGKPSATALSSIAPPAAGTWLVLDVTSHFNGWVAGTTPNHGVRLRPTNTNNSWVEFRSSDYTDDPTLRPKLVVTYAP